MASQYISLLTSFRALFRMEPDEQLFREIVEWIDTCVDDALKEEATRIAIELLDSWPDVLREIPLREIWPSFPEGDAPALLQLVRTLALSLPNEHVPDFEEEEYDEEGEEEYEEWSRRQDEREEALWAAHIDREVEAFAVGLGTLTKSPYSSGLTSLSLTDCALRDEQIDILVSHSQLTNLKALYLYDNRHGGRGLEALLQSPIMSSLETLEYEGPDEESVCALALSPQVRQLKHLSLFFGEIGDQGAIALAQSENLEGLEKLDLSSTKIGKAGAEALLHSPHLSGLQYLSFDSNPIGHGIEVSASFTKLSTLRLNDCELGEESVKAILLACSSSPLSFLLLNGNGIGNSIVELLATLPCLETIRNLYLYNNNIDARGLSALVSAPLLASIRTLQLGNNRIDDEGAAFIADAPSLSALEHLMLDGNNLTRGGYLRLMGSPFLKRHLRRGALEKLGRDEWMNTAWLFGIQDTMAMDKGELLDVLLNTQERTWADEDGVDTFLFARLRELLAAEPSKDAFAQILLFFSLAAWEGEESGMMAREYVEEHLAQWPDDCRRASNLDWWPDCPSKPPPPLFQLVRSLWLEFSNGGLGSAAHRNGDLVKQLASYPMLQCLTHLEMASDTMFADGLNEILQSPYLQQLKVIIADTNNMASIDRYASLIDCDWTHLRELRLYQTRINDKGAMALASSPVLAHLELLDLRDNEITAVGAESLARSPYARDVDVILLRGNPIADEGVEALLRTSILFRNETLDLGQCQLGPESVKAIVSRPEFANVRAFRVGSNDIGVEGAEAIASSPFSVGLRTLQLGRCKLGPEGVVALTRSPYLQELHTLDLSLNEFGDEAVQALVQWPALETLKSLQLSENQISDGGLELLLSSPFLQCLEEFGLSNTSVSGTALELIASSPSMRQLKRLLLSRNRADFRVEQLIQLIASPYVTRLERLSVKRELWTMESLARLANSPNMKQLEPYALYHNQCGDDGFLLLAHSPYLPRETRVAMLRQVSLLILRDEARRLGVYAPWHPWISGDLPKIAELIMDKLDSPG